MKSAYTLLELLIVIAIIGILTVLAIPSYQKYSANQVLEQKADEIKGLFEKAYTIAKSPEQGVTQYIVVPDKTDGRFVLYRQDPIQDPAVVTFSEIDRIQVNADSNEYISCSTSGGCENFHCSAAVNDSTISCGMYVPGATLDKDSLDPLATPSIFVNDPDVNKKFSIDVAKMGTDGPVLTFSSLQ